MSITSERIRIEWTANDAKRDAGLKTPENVVRFDGLRYGPYPAWNLLDVYRPKGVEGKLPVIVSVHGGGWVYGDKELYQFYCMDLTKRGFAVVNFTYRLAPEFKYPAPLADTNRVIEWMYDHADEYGLDMEKVSMVGDSAGGHLAALYGSICTNPEYAREYDFTVPNGFKPIALGLNCGAYIPLGGDTELENKEQDMALMRDFLPEGGSEREALLINASRHITKDYPPVFLMSCVGDFCLPQAAPMEQALKEAGAHYEYKVYGTEQEPLYHVFHVAVQEPMGQICNDEECAFFKQWM